MRVIYDGWPLVYNSAGPEALHLWELLEARPEAVEAWVALPARYDLPSELHGVYARAPGTTAGRLRWEQATLPRLVKKSGADLLHTTACPPLFCPVPCVASPVESIPRGNPAFGLAGRLRASFGQGGLARARGVLWPSDLPDLPESYFSAPVWRIPVYVHSAFFQQQPRPGSLPDDYVYAPGPWNAPALDLLGDAWRWACAGLGDTWTLLVDGLTAGEIERLNARCDPRGTCGPVVAAALYTPALRAAAYQHAGAALAAGPFFAWGGVIQHALACACPLVGEETALAGQRVGPAGFLTPPGDARALGAALITTLVEESVAKSLRLAARKRTAGWSIENFRAGLAAVYAEAVRYGSGTH